MSGRRAITLRAPADFELPPLDAESLEQRIFSRIVHDTRDRRLAAAHIVLERRVENGAGSWMLEFPSAAGPQRRSVPGGPAGPPQELADLLFAHVRGEQLVPVDETQIRRRSFLLNDGAGPPVAEVVHDVVVTLDARRVVDSFAELRVQALAGRERELSRIGKLLRRAGARRLIGAPRRAKPKPARDASTQVELQFRAQVHALLAADPATRVGQDSEDLHDLRVATRRLRAYLRSPKPLLDESWSEPLRAELAWLAGLLGAVRDLDVLLERLRAETASLDPTEATSLDPIFDALEQERAAARGVLLDSMRSDRYLELLERLQDSPSFSDARVSLQKLAAKEFDRLRRSVEGLGAVPGDDELHALRIRGKRARYAAELTGSRGATKFAERAKELQDVLGEHQDAVVAEERLRAAVGSSADVALGRLVERERARRAAARAEWPETWRRLQASGRRTWR